MKSPEEIKKGLDICSNSARCRGCPYLVYVEGSCGCHEMGCEDDLLPDALAYIKQLEAERDAAVADIEESQPCFACKNFKRNSGNCGGGKRCLRLAEIAMRNGGTYKGKFFEWRGVQKEDSND